MIIILGKVTQSSVPWLAELKLKYLGRKLWNLDSKKNSTVTWICSDCSDKSVLKNESPWPAGDAAGVNKSWFGP